MANQFQFAEAYTELTVRDAKFRTAMNTAHGKLLKLKGQMEGVAQTTQRLFMGAGAALAYFVKKASDAEEIGSKFNAVFKEGAADARKWADEYSKAVGRSKYDMEAYMSSFQDTFVPLGFARDKAADLSKQMTKLALDIASFNNVAEPETAQLLTSALVGNHEAVRRFGVVLTEATVKQELMAMGIKDNVAQASNLDKVMARLNIIMRSTSDAQGDAVRTAGSAANQWKRFTSELSELGIEIGKVFIPMMKRGTAAMGEWLNNLKKMPAANAESIQSFVAMAAGIGGVIVLAPKLISAFAAIAAGVAPLALAVGGLTAALGLLAATFVNAQMKGITFGESAADMLNAIGLPGFGGPAAQRAAQAESNRQRGGVVSWQDAMRATIDKAFGSRATQQMPSEEQQAADNIEKQWKDTQSAAETAARNYQEAQKMLEKMQGRRASYNFGGYTNDQISTQERLALQLKTVADQTAIDVNSNRTLYERYAAARERLQFEDRAGASVASGRAGLQGRLASVASALFGPDVADQWKKAQDEVRARNKGKVGELLGGLFGEKEEGGGLASLLFGAGLKSDIGQKLTASIAAVFGGKGGKNIGDVLQQLAGSGGGGQFLGFAQLAQFMQQQISRGEEKIIELADKQLRQQEKIEEAIKEQKNDFNLKMDAVWG